MAEGTITARGKMLLRLPPPAPPPIPFYEAGGSTFHTHACITEKESHQWLCNSPYCATIPELCPDHGGNEPIRVGHEPWRR
jgi:hypothetical protein